jgi:regulatory protein
MAGTGKTARKGRRKRKEETGLPGNEDRTLHPSITAAYRYLSYRDRSREEVRKKLTEKGFSPEIIEQTLQRLEDHNLIQDESFALRYGRSQIRSKLLGPARLKEVLREKGVPPDVIHKTLAVLYEEHPALEVAREALRKKIQNLESIDSVRDRRRAVDFLRRRGFEYDMINNLLQEL